ncbi:ShlB/FhaC/HecB family hemolysin secretion/activation protein [Yoonia sp. GPGPB17]|uniref:ShlB/FhaC/HecB family hemolysin secretion/activation protein n=1 Tax=Yoonia sp. GPGPB17 TaxID=3026147 RepID=UPI0030C29728
MRATGLAATFVVCGSSVIAQTAIDDAAAQAAAIERERSQQQVESPLRAPSGVRPQPPVPARTLDGQTCIDVDTVDVRDVTLIPLNRIEELVAPFEAQCLGLAEINSVLEAVTFAYVETGYVAARAFLPEQDLSDGTLKVVVVEGKLEAIVMNRDEQSLRGQRATAFPAMIGEPVNLRDIEQGLDQLSRLRSVDATMQIAAGAEQGGSILAVSREAGRPWHGSLSFNDLGSASTGEFQTRLSLGFDDLLGLNDTIAFSYQRSMDDHPLAFSNDRPNGDTWTAKFEVPYGYWTFAIDGDRNAYRSEIEGALGPIETSGNSSTAGLTASRVLHRDQISKTTLTGTLTAKETESFILGSRVDVSSRRLSIFDFDISHSRQVWGGQGSGSISVSRGLDIWGALDDGEAADGSPRAQFTKYDLSVGYSRDFMAATQPVNYDARLTAQWSDDLLFGSEQISLGGDSSVRGSESSLMFGNRGVMLRNEFAAPLNAFSDPAYARTFGQLVPYFAFDLGRIAPQPSFDIAGGTLSGAAFGLRSQGGRLAFDISYADILSQPTDLPENGPETGVFAASLTITF